MPTKKITVYSVTSDDGYELGQFENQKVAEIFELLCLNDGIIDDSPNEEIESNKMIANKLYGMGSDLKKMLIKSLS